MTTPTEKKKLFVMPDGKNLVVTFSLVSSLFLLWGFGNGMIDVMDRHFQEELNLTLSQSANVQWAHYLGYFLMSLPAGWLATKLGYKLGIIIGLLMVAAGGLWFIPATHIAEFWAFLVGVCFIASGFTFLETIANPYTTVLGPNQFAATRINLAQSCNGIGWILGPIVGSAYFYSKNAAGQSTGSETLWIPYAGIAVIVSVLAVIFWFADVPDIKAEDDYHLDDGTPGAKRSIWTHPHFVFAVAAQFLYVAAQAGIFSFLVNYMIAEVPAMPGSWQTSFTKDWIEVRTTFVKPDLVDLPALAERLKAEKPDPMAAYVKSQLSESTAAALEKFDPASPAAVDVERFRAELVGDLNKIVKQDPDKVVKKGLKDAEKKGITKDPNEIKKSGVLYFDPQHYAGVALSGRTKKLLDRKIAEDKVLAEKKELPEGQDMVDLPMLNRLLLTDAFPKEFAFDEGFFGFSDGGAALLASVGFVFFLIGRFSGAALLKKFSAHKILALYGLLNTLVCFLIFLKLGWISVGCVFLSYFFMSIMFPTIFALGIFGLGARAKKASAFIVMAIMGGAVLPKLMGHIADEYNMSRGFIVPLVCFAAIALYGYCWPRLSGAESLSGVQTAGH
jgi:fucose permease